MYTMSMQQGQNREVMCANTDFGASCGACMQDKHIMDAAGHTFVVCPVLLLAILSVLVVANVVLLALAIILLVLVASVDSHQTKPETKLVCH